METRQWGLEAQKRIFSADSSPDLLRAWMPLPSAGERIEGRQSLEPTMGSLLSFMGILCFSGWSARALSPFNRWVHWASTTRQVLCTAYLQARRRLKGKVWQPEKPVESSFTQESKNCNSWFRQKPKQCPNNWVKASGFRERNGIITWGDKKSCWCCQAAIWTTKGGLLILFIQKACDHQSLVIRMSNFLLTLFVNNSDLFSWN